MTICFAERDARFKDPRIFQMLGLGHITAFAQVSFFYVPGREEWDAWLTPANELRDLEWLQQQPKGRRAVHLGGWFASDEFPEWHGNTAAKRMAFEIARLFPGEEKPLDLLFIDYEWSKWSGLDLRVMLADLLPLCERVSCFNFYNGPGYWGGTGTTADPRDLDNRRKTPIDAGAPELYGGARQPLRFKRAIRLNPGCTPLFPVCSRDTDWSQIAPWAEVINGSRNLLRYWHEHDERNRVCIAAPYMLNEIRGGPIENYWRGEVVGPGRSLEWLFAFDRMLGELPGSA